MTRVIEVTGYDPIICMECGSRVNYGEVALEVPDYMMSGFEDAGLPESKSLVEIKVGRARYIAA